MRRYWYQRVLIIVLVFSLTIVGGVYLVKEQQKVLQTEVSANTSDTLLIPGGMPIGIYLETEGVMVLGTDAIEGVDGINYEPATHLVKAGDYIVAVEDERISDKDKLIEVMKKMDHETVVLKVRRAEQLIDIKLKAVQCEDQSYKLGIWVRDNAQGLGTVTFLNGKSEFGALGHGIHDVDTNLLMEISQGTLYNTSIKDIQKGADGVPGGMQGIIIYNNYNVLGTITQNTEEGIFGTVDRIDSVFSEQKPMEIMKKEDIKTGNATIRCAVNGTIGEYQIRITKIDTESQEANKGIVLEVTDETLLKLTGGIIQGMSGSPIIQEDKIVGAVTHVFVQDATKGYGIFIENMLKHLES